ncbi:MAG: HNH endonuclease, partial [Jatrophihabitantaceae bacterium]
MSKSHGVPLRLSQADRARYAALITLTDSCAIWVGAIGSDGYGRFSVQWPDGRQRTVTPHQVAATLAVGPLVAGVTLLHDCDVRLCVRVAEGHLHVGTQAENAQQAARRGRMRGPRPGLVDVRGKVGQSRAIQKALRASPDRSPA